MTYYPGMIGLPDARVAADAATSRGRSPPTSSCPDGKAEGMIVTHGGLEGGYGLYLRDGKPTFVYNFLSVERPTFAGDGAAAQGQGDDRRRLRRTTAAAWARAARSRMTANGKKIAEGRLERTDPGPVLASAKALDIGMDSGSPIDFTYQLPFAFTGKIEKVTIELKPLKDAAAQLRRKAA